jgi:hypothetical protein
MPFFSAYDLRVSSAAKVVANPAPIRATLSKNPDTGKRFLIVTPCFSLIPKHPYIK